MDEQILKMLFSNSGANLNNLSKSINGSGNIAKAVGAFLDSGTVPKVAHSAKQFLGIGGAINPLVMGAINLPIAVNNMKMLMPNATAPIALDAKRRLDAIEAQKIAEGLKKKKPITPLAPANTPVKPQTKQQSLPPLPSVAGGNYNGNGGSLGDFIRANQGSYQPEIMTQQPDGSFVGGLPQVNSQQAVGGGAPTEIIPQSELALQRLQQVRDYLGKYTPEDYMKAINADEARAIRDKAFSQFVGSKSYAQHKGELAKEQEVLNYLKQGYDVDTALNANQQQLADAQAYSKATGIPMSYLLDPKDVMGMIKGQQTAQGQLDVARQYGLNQGAIAKMNNQTKLAIAEAINQYNQAKLKNNLDIAEINAKARNFGALGTGVAGGMVDQDAMMQLYNLFYGNPTGGNLLPTNFGNAGDSY